MNKFIPISKDSPVNYKIYEEADKNLMDARLEIEKQQGFLNGGEQCFRDDYPWYRLNIGYTNPLNFGEVHAELELLKKHVRMGADDAIPPYFKNKHLIFYGIGVGDTEIEFVDWAIKLGQKEIFITGIDINKKFLENFIIALKNRSIEPDEPIMHFSPRNALFEQITKKELALNKTNNAHICLGGTIGNFKNQNELFEMFSNLINTGDSLILSFQLKNNIEWIIKKYQENPLYPDFILNYIPTNERKEIYWTMNNKIGVITAKHENIEVFRTTKYSKEELKEIVSSKGFKFCYEDIDRYNNSCIQIFEKI
ncbi:MAG: L-histidine N(alpha)-methyltransferase [Patescibacteria group bacterium]